MGLQLRMKKRADEIIPLLMGSDTVRPVPPSIHYPLATIHFPLSHCHVTYVLSLHRNSPYDLRVEDGEILSLLASETACRYESYGRSCQPALLQHIFNLP